MVLHRHLRGSRLHRSGVVDLVLGLARWIVGALPGLRAMAPGRRERTRATTPNLDSAESRTEAMLALEMDVKAQTTHGSDESRLITMEAWLSKWGATVVPTHNC